MHIPPQDAGVVRWYMLIPSFGLLAIPPAVRPENRVEYARNSGATLVRKGNEIVWRAELTPQVRSGRGHLAVVK